MTVDDMILAVRNGLEDGDAVEHITRALADEVERLRAGLDDMTDEIDRLRDALADLRGVL